MRLSLVSALSLVLAAQAGAAPAPTFSADRIHADVGFLADDLLEGRGTGSRGHDLAALYVAQRFASLGLSPGNGASWFQPISFITASVVPGQPSAITIGGQRFANGGHFIARPLVQADRIDRNAEVVFVGYGLEDKSLGLDDYAGLDVKGKVVAYLWGTPEGLPSEIAATLNDHKADFAEAHGAIGNFAIATPTLAKVAAWDRLVYNRAFPQMRWVHPDQHPELRNASQLLGGGLIDETAANRLFAGTPLGDGKLAAAIANPKARPKGFLLPGAVRFELFSRIDKVVSPNVVGFIPGSDPKLANQVVMISAHLDHLGIADGKTADKINNGAMDNGAGVATMLEVARAFATSTNRPRRSVMFVALTGEEKGLLGSEYLSNYPLPAGRKLVANVNLDEPMLTYDFKDVIAYGAEHSTVGRAVERAAKSMGVALSPDPAPEQNSFVRSDHYSFVKKGVPSISLGTGEMNGGKAAHADYEEHRYHQVTDDMSQAFNWQAGAKFAKLNYLIARDLADSPLTPRWYAGDYFGNEFAKDQPKAPH